MRISAGVDNQPCPLHFIYKTGLFAFPINFSLMAYTILFYALKNLLFTTTPFFST